MRTVTSRNFWGGFWGGVLGILAFAWYPVLLPFGCFGGVIAGFWYQEIGAIIRESVMRPTYFMRRSFSRLCERAARSSALSSFARAAVRRIAASLIRGASNTRWFVMLILQQSTARLRAHPMNQVAALSFISLLCWSQLLGFVWGKMLPLPEGSTNSQSGLVSTIAALWATITVFAGMIGSVAFFARHLNNSSDLRSFYRRWERYSRFAGILRTIIADSWCLFRASVAFAIAWWLLTMALFLALFIGLPVLALYLGALIGVRVACRIAVRPNHWLCFAATLAVTGAGAFLAQPHLRGVTLWLLAIAIGCTAGAATELVRRACGRALGALSSVSTFVTGSLKGDLDRFGKWSWQLCRRLWAHYRPEARRLTYWALSS